jgi:small conductance mechanosensitive channel
MLEPEKISEMIDLYVIPWGINIVMALVIFIVGRIVIGLIVGGLGKVLAKSKYDAMLIDFVKAITSAILTVFVVIAALDKLGVNTTSFAAILAAAGLAIGLSLQGSLQNFASGVMLLIFRPFKSGDYVEAGGTSGSVKSVSIFTTTILTPDNKLILVPNGNIYGGNIVNYSAKETRRVDMVFGIGYDDDLRKAKKLLETMVAEDERILSDPAPQVAVSELGDSSVNFVVRPWVKSGDYWGVMFDFTEAVKLRFDEEGISIPFPQMDVHVHKESNAE